MHRTATINEVSARYVQLPAEWYIPDPENVGICSATNKQGRDLVDWHSLSGAKQDVILDFLEELDNHNTAGYQKYEYALQRGIPPELARCFLQLNHYTHLVWKQDLHNMMHFLALRLDNHAQFEAREFAKAIYEFLAVFLPNTMKLFRKYRLLT